MALYKFIHIPKNAGSACVKFMEDNSAGIAYRFILWGGYIEELSDGTFKKVKPFTVVYTNY